MKKECSNNTDMAIRITISEFKRIVRDIIHEVGADRKSLANDSTKELKLYSRNTELLKDIKSNPVMNKICSVDYTGYVYFQMKHYQTVISFLTRNGYIRVKDYKITS